LALILTLSIVFFSLAVFNLGFLRTPVRGWQPTGETDVYLDLGSVRRVDSIYVLLGDAQSVMFDVYVGQPGRWEYSTSFRDEWYYGWRSVALAEAETRYIRLFFYGKTGKINEIFLVNEDGEKIRIDRIWGGEGVEPAVKRLVDEQELVEWPPTYRSQTYFDEIYYVRTAEEYLKGAELYEWTHPPLGKLLIAFSISLLGFSPFAWRIIGVLFATLMVPLIYLLGREMFRRRIAAFIAAFLLTFDFLHFTMGRIATVDTFAVFFTVASTLLFYLNYREISAGDFKFKGYLVFLAFLLFALAFSTKWYVLYGLIGQLFLLLLFALKGFIASQSNLTTKFKEYLSQPLKPLLGLPSLLKALRPHLHGLALDIEKYLMKPFAVILLSALVSGLVYVSTFIPYMMAGHSLTDVYTRQWTMYNYHAQLEATHPFSSAWWSWPLIIRPLWLYVSYLPDGMVSTITAMGNPAIWWFGLVSIITIFWRLIKGRDKNCLFILCIFLFQWLPYAFISRCLFIYHFYVNVPMLILATTYLLNESWESKGGRAFVAAYLSLTAILFILFYPVISGYPIPYSYKEFLRWFNSWVF